MTKTEMKQLNKGDLIYLPSQITLFRYEEGEEESYLKQAITIDAPMTTAFLNHKEDNLCNILYNGETWGVDLKNVFALGDKQ